MTSVILLSRYPKSWDEEKQAGKTWCYKCINAHSQYISLRTAEAKSLSRSTSFNKEKVANFFRNSKVVMEKHKFQPSQTWNCDESGISTVHVLPRVVAEKDVMQIYGITSAERGSSVTIICAVSAVGIFVSRMFIFPHARFQDHM